MNPEICPNCGTDHMDIWKVNDAYHDQAFGALIHAAALGLEA